MVIVLYACKIVIKIKAQRTKSWVFLQKRRGILANEIFFFYKKEDVRAYVPVGNTLPDPFWVSFETCPCPVLAMWVCLEK